MNETTILVWINIAIVGIIAIIIVKLYFRKDELEKDDSPLLSKDSLDGLIPSNKNNQNNLSKTAPTKSFVSTYFSKQDQPKGTSLRKQGQIPEDNFNSYIVPETNEHLFFNKIETKEEEEPGKPINFNYETKVQKFQEPINETQMDIMSKNNKNMKKEKNENNISLEEKPKHELKDLFSIDELIKESKRKDNEREKESKTIRKEKEDTTEIKKSIKQMKEGKKEESPITEIKKDSIESITETPAESKKEVNFYDAVNDTTKDKVKEKSDTEDIANAIKSSKKEEKTPKDESIADILAKDKKEEITGDVSKEENIKDILIEDEKEDKTPEEENIADVLANDEEIKTPTLKSPTKIESKEDELSVLPAVEEDYEFEAPLEESELFKDEEEPEENVLSDLDYRKDLAKITNTIKNSKIFNEVKEKLAPENQINEKEHITDEMYLRNVGTYKEEEPAFPEYEPIINERHEEYPSDYDYTEPTQEQLLRQENTRKVLNMVKNSETEKASQTLKIKEKPEKNNLKIKINNDEVILRKGAEIIFKHDGESYSSKVYGIRGNDISVKYRGKKITINPKDIKKIY